MFFDSISKAIHGLTYADGSFDKLGYEDCDPKARAHLEKIFRVFIDGYTIARKASNLEKVYQTIEGHFDPHFVGFAFEGAGMYIAMEDLLIPWKSGRLKDFVEGPAIRHDYITAVGAGFAVARMPSGLNLVESYIKKLNPMIAWCVPDGYGFHQGIFQHTLYIDQCKEAPSNFPDYARQLFDSGIGRSIWWVKGADPLKIKRAIDKFQKPRRAELWCGIGLAAAYAGSFNKEVVDQLKVLSGEYKGDFLSGMPFAARMRQKGRNPSAWTSDTCRRLLGMSTDEAANYIQGTLEKVMAEMGISPQQVAINFNKFKGAYKIVRERMTTYFDTKSYTSA